MATRCNCAGGGSGSGGGSIALPLSGTQVTISYDPGDGVITQSATAWVAQLIGAFNNLVTFIFHPPVQTATIGGSFFAMSESWLSLTMTGNTTFSFAPDASYEIILRLAGAFTPTWPASVKWPNGVTPTYSTPSFYRFRTFDGGTTWYGELVGAHMI